MQSALSGLCPNLVVDTASLPKAENTHYYQSALSADGKELANLILKLIMLMSSSSGHYVLLSCSEYYLCLICLPFLIKTIFSEITRNEATYYIKENCSRTYH